MPYVGHLLSLLSVASLPTALTHIRFFMLVGLPNGVRMVMYILAGYRPLTQAVWRRVYRYVALVRDYFRKDTCFRTRTVLGCALNSVMSSFISTKPDWLSVKVYGVE